MAPALDCRQFISKVKGELLFSDSDEAFIRLGEVQYVYCFQFGIVSFFNCPDELQEKLSQGISKAGLVDSESLTEDFMVEVRPGPSKVSFNKVTIPKLHPDRIRLIMLYTAQSVILDRYTEITQSLMEEASVYTSNLQYKGRLHISRKRLKRLIGRNLNLKNGMMEHLYVFDSPDLIWDDPDLTKLDADLKQTFDLRNRNRHLHDRLDIIKENLELFKDIWDHRESSMLEWIIILLILVEVVDLFLVKLF